MSAPETHDPVVVNTKDGSVWVRRAVTAQGRGLYALEGTPQCCPEYVLTSLRELAEIGLRGMAFALPVPVGSGLRVVGPGRAYRRLRTAMLAVQRDRRNLRARVVELEAERDALLAERHVTNEALDDAVQALRALERKPRPDGITRRIAPMQSLRKDDPFGLHHDYLMGRDLPETGGLR